MPNRAPVLIMSNRVQSDYSVCVAESILMANTARAHANRDFMASNSDPVVRNDAVPLIRKPVPGPFRPCTLMLPKVTRTLLLKSILAWVLWK